MIGIYCMKLFLHKKFIKDDKNFIKSVRERLRGSINVNFNSLVILSLRELPMYFSKLSRDTLGKRYVIWQKILAALNSNILDTVKQTIHYKLENFKLISGNMRTTENNSNKYLQA